MTPLTITFLNYGTCENMVLGAVHKINWNKDLISGIYLVTLDS